MAHDLSIAYPGKVFIDSNNPKGTFKNRTSDVLKDGTPLEETWQRDVWGFLSHSLKKLEIVPNELEENETQSQYFDAFKSMYSSISGFSDNLILINNSTNPNYQIDIDANSVILKNSSGLSFFSGLINLTIDLTVSGLNGLDTGTESSSTLYYIYVIYNPVTQTLAGLFSINPSIPTLPSGYTFYAPIGTVYNNSAGNLGYPVSLFQLRRKKLYRGDGTDFTLSGTGGTFFNARAFLEQDDQGEWYIDIRFKVIVPSTARFSYSVTVSGVTFQGSDYQPLVCFTDVSSAYAPRARVTVSGNQISIEHPTITTTDYSIWSILRLPDKPTWA